MIFNYEKKKKKKNSGVSTSADTEWLVVAHEMGHNFGAKHDCTSTCSGASDTSCCTCPPGCDCKATYIMHPSNSISTHTFSPCSQTTMCSRSAITGVCFEGFLFSFYFQKFYLLIKLFFFFKKKKNLVLEQL